MGILLTLFASRISQCVFALLKAGVNAGGRGGKTPFFLFFLDFKYISVPSPKQARDDMGVRGPNY